MNKLTNNFKRLIMIKLISIFNHIGEIALTQGIIMEQLWLFRLQQMNLLITRQDLTRIIYINMFVSLYCKYFISTYVVPQLSAKHVLLVWYVDEIACKSKYMFTNIKQPTVPTERYLMRRANAKSQLHCMYVCTFQIAVQHGAQGDGTVRTRHSYSDADDSTACVLRFTLCLTL